jgi:hypothetical protein
MSALAAVSESATSQELLLRALRAATRAPDVLRFDMTTDALGAELTNLEHRRLKSLVEGRLADALHAPNFELIIPAVGLVQRRLPRRHRIR